MIGNVVDYDKKFRDDFPRFNPSLDPVLKKYLHFVKGSNVLDLGIGQGQNSIPLANLGFNVTGVDYSSKCIDICKSNCPNLDLIRCDIRKFDIVKNHFDLIMSRAVLHFFHKDDFYNIIDSIKAGLVKGGLVYISVFSIDEFSLSSKYSKGCFDLLDRNILHNLDNDTYVSFFTKDEILSLFDGFEVFSISDSCFLDISGSKPHYHGMISFLGRK